jgi:Domain of unknown function (DUF4345)
MGIEKPAMKEGRMASLILRILIAVLGTVSLLIGLNGWRSPDALAKQLELVTTGPLGLATMRADVSGLFLSIGIFMIMAAWRKNGVWAFGAMILVGTPLLGRVINLIANGAGAGTIQPMIIEAVLVILLVAARLAWRRPPSGLL